jgi:hypothetical protein
MPSCCSGACRGCLAPRPLLQPRVRVLVRGGPLTPPCLLQAPTSSTAAAGPRARGRGARTWATCRCLRPATWRAPATASPTAPGPARGRASWRSSSTSPMRPGPPWHRSPCPRSVVQRWPVASLHLCEVTVIVKLYICSAELPANGCRGQLRRSGSCHGCMLGYDVLCVCPIDQRCSTNVYHLLGATPGLDGPGQCSSSGCVHVRMAAFERSQHAAASLPHTSRPQCLCTVSTLHSLFTCQSFTCYSGASPGGNNNTSSSQLDPIIGLQSRHQCIMPRTADCSRCARQPRRWSSLIMRARLLNTCTQRDGSKQGAEAPVPACRTLRGSSGSRWAGGARSL